MNILIIGSDSFIASNFINYYSNKYNINSISRNGVKYENEIEIKDFFNISIDHFKNIDVVINFAAIVHRTDIKDDGVYENINYKLSILNAQKAKTSGVKLFIQLSTISVYGKVSDISVLTPCNPVNAYGKSKLRADIELDLMRSSEFGVAIIRPSMVYGNGNAPGNMMRLIKLVNMQIPLPFKGIDNKRDFIHVHNLCQYIEHIAVNKKVGTYLVIDNEPISTENLVNLISENLNKRVYQFKIPGIFLLFVKKILPGLHDKLFGSLNIESNFGEFIIPEKKGIEQGIAEMVNWFKQNTSK